MLLQCNDRLYSGVTFGELRLMFFEHQSLINGLINFLLLVSLRKTMGEENMTTNSIFTLYLCVCYKNNIKPLTKKIDKENE